MAIVGLDSCLEMSKKLKSYVDTGMDIGIDMAVEINELNIRLNANERNKLQASMGKYAKMELEMKQYKEAVQYVQEQYANRDPNGENPNLEEILQARLQEIRERDQGIDIQDHDKYREFTQKLEGQQPDTENGDDDLQMMQQDVSNKCPVTGKELVVPMKNKICGHVYDKEGVQQLIKQRKQKAKCPVVGCGNREPITMDQLVEDRKLQRQLGRERKQKT